jgi:hypothetical protein
VYAEAMIEAEKTKEDKERITECLK